MMPSLRVARRARWFGVAFAAAALGSTGCAPSWIIHSRFVSSASGESVLFTAKSPSVGVWLRRRSLDDGRLLASVRVFWNTVNHSSKVECVRSVPGRLWCLEENTGSNDAPGLRARDEESLEVIAEQGDMVGRAPELTGTRPLDRWNIDPKTHGFKLESRDGYVWIIDPITLTPSHFDGPLGSPAHAERRDSWITVAGDTYRIGDGARAPLLRNERRLQPDHTYLRAHMGPSVEGWPYVLVIEEGTASDGFTLWCLRPDGTVMWKVTDLGEPRQLTAKLYKDTLVLVGYTMILALRKEDGAVLWRSPP